MALNGLRYSGAALREFLDERLDEMGFKSSISDPDLWIRPATKTYGEQYYELILVYVKKLLAIIQEALLVIREVADKFRLEKEKTEPPDI